jgi:DNA-binding transcriptional LysR family regulator
MNHSGYRYKQNRCQQLRGFCYAASMGSISKAAKRIGLSQPAVSQQISSLENELAVTLFVRGGSSIHLTPDGELLLKMVKPIVEKLEHLDKEFRHQRAEIEEGYVEVAAGGSTILYVLPKYVGAFRHANPRIEVRLHNVTGVEGLAQLRVGLVDFAVGPMLEVPEDLEFRAMLSYEPVVITCLGHPLAKKKAPSLEDISRYPLILPPRSLSTWRIVDNTFKKFGLSYRVSMEVGGWEAIKKYVALGMGISIISSVGITDAEKLEVIPAGEFFPKRMYGVVLRKESILSPQAQRFVSLLLAKNGATAASPARGNHVPKPNGVVSQSATDPSAEGH